MRSPFMLISVLLVGAFLARAIANPPPVNPPPIAGAGEAEFTDDFGLEHCDKLGPSGDSLYFPIEVGAFRRYEGFDDGEFIELEIRVLDEIKIIDFEVNGVLKRAKARVVQEKEWIDGELVEKSKNYFAFCSKTGNLYYFGEKVNFYEDGEVVNHDGSWLAGEDDAVPGLIMPSVFILGARYYQEVAPGIALDRAKHVRSGLEVETPAGTFENCVKVLETTPLEPGAEGIKIYAPGIGLIVDETIELVEYDLGG